MTEAKRTFQSYGWTELAARAAFFGALAFAWLMALLPKPPHLPIDRFGDKFEHVLAFATLTALASVAFPEVNRWRRAEHLSYMGALIEVFQSIPALHRDCDIRDWFADTLAILAITMIAWLLFPRRSQRANACSKAAKSALS